MKNNARASWIHGVAVVGLLASSAFAQTVVYKNTETPLDAYFASQTEFGDQITISGGGYRATAFTFEYFASGVDASSSAVLRFYRNDGVPLDSTSVQAPGSLFYQSVDIPLYNGNFPQQVIDLPEGMDLLPSTFTWTITPKNLPGGAVFGLKLYDPPTVGSSFDDIWQFTPTGWSLIQVPGYTANFGAELIAVPEPGVVSLLAVGGLALLMRRRSASR